MDVDYDKWAVIWDKWHMTNHMWKLISDMWHDIIPYRIDMSCDIGTYDIHILLEMSGLFLF